MLTLAAGTVDGVVELELALIERKQSRQFRHKDSRRFKKDTKGFALVGTVPSSKVM